MFGFNKLTPKEQKEHDKNRRIKFLEKEIDKERVVRQESLAKATAYNNELSLLLGK
jgi:hypothetical protein